MRTVSAGVERVLEKAAEDAAFRVALTAAQGAARVDVAKAASIDLTATEAAVLGAVPAEDLRRMVQEAITTRERRRALLRMALGTTAVGLGGICAAFFVCPRHYIVSAGDRADMPVQPSPRLTGWLLTDDLVGPRSWEEILDALRSGFANSGVSAWTVRAGAEAPTNSVGFRVGLSAEGTVAELRWSDLVGAAWQDVVRRCAKALTDDCRFPPASGPSEFTVWLVVEDRSGPSRH
ncbi:MAG: hypothetical protein HY905_14010 [Deltaproteobacteria bacterium]|nr:hypothetical protein [Deltaproteobacteria bacterium]